MMERALADYIVNALWQVPFLAGGAWLLVRALRPAPLMQHRLWLAVLGLAMVLPVFGMAGEPAKQPASRAVPPLSSNEMQYAAALPQARTIRLSATVTHWLVRLYLATVVFGLLRIARAWRAALHLAGHARETSRHKIELAHYSRRFGVKTPQLRESLEVSSPMIVGAVSPVLLLPEGFDQFTADEVEAALCHELAHIKRHDYVMNVVCQVAALPLAWHPVMYEVQQRIRLTREMVCDAMAAQEMKSKIGYAKCLLALAHSMLGASRVSGQAQGLFSNHAVEERVMRLMETTTMSVRARATRAASGAVVMIAAGAMAAMFHVTPTMAEPGTGAASQAVQTAPAAPPLASRPKPPAGPVDKPAGNRHTARSIHRNGCSEQQPALTAEERERIDRDIKRQMEDMKRQMSEATAHLNSPEFKQQMEDMKRQMAAATAHLNSPEFRQQMEDMKRQVAAATAHLNSPEFKQQMEDMQKELQSDEFKRKLDEDIRRSEEAPSQPGNTP